MKVNDIKKLRAASTYVAEIIKTLKKVKKSDLQDNWFGDSELLEMILDTLLSTKLVTVESDYYNWCGQEALWNA